MYTGVNQALRRTDFHWVLEVACPRRNPLDKRTSEMVEIVCRLIQINRRKAASLGLAACTSDIEVPHGLVNCETASGSQPNYRHSNRWLSENEHRSLYFEISQRTDNPFGCGFRESRYHWAVSDDLSLCSCVLCFPFA